MGIIFLTAPVLFSLLLPGCASLNSERNDAELAKIKRAAVVGFSLNAPASAIPGTKRERFPEHEAIYQAAIQQFEQLQKWKLLPLRMVATHAAIRSAYDRTMHGWQNRLPIEPGQHSYEIDGIPDSESIRLLGVSGRDALMSELGVDALISLHTDISLNGTSIMGIGEQRPQARCRFQVFTKGMRQPSWFEGGLIGEESKTSIGMTKYFDEQLLHRLATDSAKSGFAKLARRMRP